MHTLKNACKINMRDNILKRNTNILLCESSLKRRAIISWRLKDQLPLATILTVKETFGLCSWVFFVGNTAGRNMTSSALWQVKQPDWTLALIKSSCCLAGPPEYLQHLFMTAVPLSEINTWWAQTGNPAGSPESFNYIKWSVIRTLVSTKGRKAIRDLSVKKQSILLHWLNFLHWG